MKSSYYINQTSNIDSDSDSPVILLVKRSNSAKSLMLHRKHTFQSCQLLFIYSTKAKLSLYNCICKVQHHICTLYRPLVRPNMPLVRPNMPLVRPNMPLVRPNMPLVRPNMPLVRPNMPLYSLLQLPDLSVVGVQLQL